VRRRRVASAGAEHVASATEHSKASGGNRGSARAGESGSRREKTERVKGRKGKTKMGLFLFFFLAQIQGSMRLPSGLRLGGSAF